MISREALTRAQKALTPFDVYLKDAHAYVSDDFDPKYQANDATFQLRHSVRDGASKFQITDEEERSDQADIFRFLVETGLRFIEGTNADKEQDPKVRAELTATWVVEYRLKSGQDLSATDLDEFGKKNVLLHVWPYWREFIQTMCARFRLPQVVLPMYRLEMEVPPSDSKPAN